MSFLLPLIATACLFASSVVTGEGPGHASPVEQYELCSSHLHVPKVALMFLANEDLTFRSLWQAWLTTAYDMLPVKQLVRAAYPANGDLDASRQKLKVAIELCRRIASNAKPQYKQYLYSFYLHNKPGREQDVPEDALMSDTEQIEPRIQTGWGQNSLVDAERLLLVQALKDLNNQFFVMVSDSSIPLYSPLVTYQQLADRQISAIDTCTTATSRWRPDMERPYLKEWHWKKSSQWFGVKRSHAQIIATDTAIWHAFQNHCGTCIADETYPATLMSAYGLTDETDCSGRLHFVNFNPEGYGGGPMPWIYTSDKFNLTTLMDMRYPEHLGEQRMDLCNASMANARVHVLYTNVKTVEPDDILPNKKGMEIDLLHPGQSEHLVQSSAVMNEIKMHRECPLFARKFPPETFSKVAELLSSPEMAVLAATAR